MVQASQNLVAQFSTLASADAQIIEDCAYNFPGVAVTIGAARWVEIADAFKLLVQDMRWSVRRPIACALHEIARVLGPELADEYLVSAAMIFLQDVDEVKAGALRHVGDFLIGMVFHHRCSSSWLMYCRDSSCVT